MNYTIRHLVGFLLFTFVCATTLQAVPAHSDSVRFSLLTCAPGKKEIYTLFGHTAIRYEDRSKGIDVVFNYGIFSFSSPNFLWRFVKGETDYTLGAVGYQAFVGEYAYYNRAVWQQTLNLTAEEKERLLHLLQTNYLPENRIYRYNFFFDNCATRPRDKIEESINGTIVYKEINHRQSFRDIVFQASKGYEWERFGMSYCLGSEADRPITYREEMFAPLYLMDAFSQAVIVDSSNQERPLVSSTLEVIPETKAEADKKFPLTPIRSALLLLIAIIAATIYGIKKKKTLWGIDLVLFAAAGLCGCIIAFLCCFSEHPAVSPNWLIFVFHPLHLIFLPFFLRKEIKGQRSRYHLVNAVVLTIFIMLWPIIPQRFDIAILPLALSLLIRSASNLIQTYKR